MVYSLRKLLEYYDDETTKFMANSDISLNLDAKFSLNSFFST